MIVQGRSLIRNDARKEKTRVKLFEMPEIEVMKIAVEDVIATSVTPTPAPEPSADDWCA